jgi:hypothetical protein
MFDETEMLLIVKLLLLTFVASIVAFNLYSIIPGYSELVNNSAGIIIAFLMLFIIKR